MAADASLQGEQRWGLKLPGPGKSLPAFSCSMSGMRFHAAGQSCLTKNAFQAREMGVQVVYPVTKNEPAKNFRKAVVIVVAIEKMSNSTPKLFTDEDLMDILSTILEPVTFDLYGCTEAPTSIYQFSKNVVCSIQDADHKSLFLHEPAQLVALHLQGDNINYAVKLKMSVYRPKIEAGTQKVPVALNIKGKKLYLSCELKGEKPVLQLEEADIQGDLDKSELGRFLFYRIDTEKHTRFESAAFPKWFICTSTQPNEAVGLTHQPGGPHVIVDYHLSSQ